jgi:inorganic pyrophosphatase
VGTTSFQKIKPLSSANVANVIIDTAKGSRNKYKWDAKFGIFTLSHVLAEGLLFPFNFGFIPNTRGGDGDPLDVLVLMEEPAFSGCMIQTRIIGNIEAEQTQQGKTNRNDRLVGVAAESRRYGQVRELDELGGAMLDEVEHFFIVYNTMRKRAFKPMRRTTAQPAIALVKKSIRNARLR